jgi:hypothetical protein
MLASMDVRPGLLVGTLFLGGCGVAGGPSPSAAQPSPTAMPSTSDLEAVGDAPAIRHGDVDASYVLPAAAIEVDGVVHVWVVAFTDGADVRPRVEHLASNDGETWTNADRPVRFTGLELDPIGPVPSSVLVASDGSWVMYGSARRPSGTPIIWRATAPGPEGPWTLDADPVLVPTAGTWASAIVDHPSVVATDDGYLMAFGGAGLAATNRNRIGVARSADGITWELVDATMPDADDTEALGPIGCGVDARTMVEPQLVAADEGWRLYFGQIRVPDGEMVISTASSTDGTAWTCASDGGALAPADLPGAPQLHSFLAFSVDGEDAVLVEALGTASTSSDIWWLAGR